MAVDVLATDSQSLTFDRHKRNWYVQPSEDHLCWYLHSLILFQDSTVAHTVDDIHADYLRRVRTVRQNVRRFISQRGSTFFVDIARNPNRSDNEKIQEIIDIRLSENLPMKEPMGWDNDDFIEYGFSRRVRISNASENLIRAAARLPPI